MRRTASVLWLVVWLTGVYQQPPALGAGSCWLEPSTGELICEDGGGGEEPGIPEPQPGKRYLYVTDRPGFGECHYWSNRPGGIDTWNPENDPTVISIVLRTPECPSVPAVDAEATAWSIFRSWQLAAPSVGLEPDGVGITGLPTFLTAPQPSALSHTEVLPDGRTLRVRADITLLSVVWGDGTDTAHGPEEAGPYPTGSVTHVYTFKTCSPEYRDTHPSGGLCHPTLDSYRITATYRWVGSYDAGGGWIDLGTVNRSTAVGYEVDELRGVPTH